MPYILFVCPKSNAAGSLLKHLLPTVHQQASECDTHQDNVLVNICVVDEQFQCIQHSGVGWQPTTPDSVEETFTNIQHDKHEDTTKDVTRSQYLPSYLHALADNLPYSGCVLEVMLIHPKFSKESFTPSVGACMRLREWHGAHFTMVLSREKAQDDGVQLLKSVLHAGVQYDDELQPLFLPQWRGVFTWMSVDNFRQPGVSLLCKNPGRLKCKLQTLHHWRQKPVAKRDSSGSDLQHLVLGRRLETLACVSLSSVPLYLIDNFQMELHVNTDSKFSMLANCLSEKDALLVRLPLYEKNALSTAAAQGLCEAAWKEGITATGRPTLDPEKSSLPCRQHLFLLITGGSQELGQYKALVMHSPTEISGSVFEQLHHLAYFGSQDNSCVKMEDGKMASEEADRWLTELPELNTNTFLMVQSIWLESMTEILQHQNERDSQLTAGELATCIREGQETLLSLAFEKKQDGHGHLSVQSPLGQILPVSDLECDPSEWPEREALADTECKEKGLRRFQSGDSIGLASPLGLVDESSLDAKDMMKWFRADGNPVLDKLSPVKLVSGQQPLSSDAEARLQWPHCKNIQYHDVYYEHNWQCEKQERYFKKFRDTIMLEEAHHTFSDHPHIPALKNRRRCRKSQLDVSCGGSKLTPITRHPSASSMMSAPLPMRNKRERTSAGRREPLISAGRLVKTLSHGDRRLSAPLPPRKHSFPGGSRQESAPPAKRLRSQESFSSPQSRNASSSVFSSSSVSGVRSLPPLRRLYQGPDVVNIFTPPTSRTGSNQVTPDSPTECSSQHVFSSDTPVTVAASSQDDGVRRLSSESNSSLLSVSNVGVSRRESRSQRHRRKLEETVAGVLEAAGVTTSDLIYSACLTKLYQVTKFFVKQLPNSRNLRAEMKEIAEKQVEQVVDLERRRQDLAVKKKLRTSSIVSNRTASQSSNSSLP